MKPFRALSLAGILGLSMLLGTARCRAAAAAFDPGGVSFDFQAISDARFALSSAAAGENLVANGGFEQALEGDAAHGRWWSAPMHLHLGDQGLKARLEEGLKALPPEERIAYGVVDTPEGKAAFIRKPLAIEAVCGEAMPSVSGRWVQVVKLPEDGAGRYRLRFRYRGDAFGKHGANYYVILEFRDAGGKTPMQGRATGPMLVQRYPGPKRSQWSDFTFDFEAPADSSWLQLALRFDGAGEVLFDDVALWKLQADQPVSVVMLPMGLMDNAFCLSSGDPAVMTFAWQRNVPKGRLALKDPVLCVELPEAVTVHAVWDHLTLLGVEAVTVDGAPRRRHRISLARVRQRLETMDGYDGYLRQALLVSTAAAAGAALPDGAYWVEDDGQPVSERQTVALRVIPGIAVATKPEIFMNGFYTGGVYLNFPEREAKELLGRFIGRTGTRWVVGKPDPELLAIYRENGVRMVTPELYYIANGYRLGDPKDKPEYARFMALGSGGHADLSRGTCPVAIYRQSEFFTQSVVPMLRENLQGFDGLWANWEPYMFNGQGCFCERCRDEFTAHAKLPADAVRAGWPAEMLVGKTYHDAWVRFRSWQHGEMVKAIHQAVDAATTGKAGFIPGVAWPTVTDSTAGLSYAQEHDIRDYAADLTYVDPWGPYPCWDALEPYSYSKGANLRSYIAARQVRDFTDRTFPAPRRPRLLAFPHGLQSAAWVTQPEAAAMDILSFFLARFEAATLYAFPKGYDNRFWAWQAQANATIARWEDIVFRGQPFEGLTVVPESPYPDPVGSDRTYFPDLPPNALLQAVGYRHDGGILAAVGNFWEKGEVFFRLTVAGLDERQAYAVLDPEGRRLFAAAAGDAHTGADLARGVLLHAGALRWAFFTVEPYRADGDYGDRVGPDAVRAAMAERLPVIAAAAERERALDAKSAAENRRSELRTMTQGGLSCQPGEAAGEQTLTFAAGDNRLVLSLDGMAVKQWQVDGVDVILGSDKLGLGVPAFWEPSVLFTAPYQVVGQEPTASGIRVVAERAVSRKLSPALEHLRVRQTLEVDQACRRVEVTTELVNESSAETGPRDLTIGFRYHLLPRCLADGGAITMRHGPNAVAFQRQFARMLFAAPSEAAAKVRALFGVAAEPVAIDAPEAVLSLPASPIRVTMALAPAERFAGFACWDGANQPTSSFEPFFAPVTIRPGETAQFSMTLTAAP